MNTRTLMKKVILIVGLLFAVNMFLIGCSDDRKAEKPGFVEKVMDSVAESVSSGLDKARVETTDTAPSADSSESPELPAIDLAVKIEDEDSAVPPIHDMLVDGSMVYAVFDGGLLVYDLASDEYSVTPTVKPLRTLAEHAGALYAGGEYLYRVDGAALTPVEVAFDGQVTELFSYGPSLMVGTTHGLYARNLLGTMMLLDSMNVTAMVSNYKGLWIGTEENGLYCWDGKTYKKRFLARDPSLFDHVTTLAAGHNHLYLGTGDGLYVFDGGSWQTYTTDEGLPSGHITSIDASDWVVLVGTANGAASLFEGEVNSVKRLDNQVITSIRKAGNRILAGTGQNGLMVKSGPAVRTIVSPWQDTNDLAALIH
jgi:hypothetical protein